MNGESVNRIPTAAFSDFFANTFDGLQIPLPALTHNHHFDTLIFRESKFLS
jgi:hypothetical protein